MPLILDEPPSSSSSSSSFAVSTTTSTTTQDDREIRRRVHHEADIVIVGAGIVGCAAAVAFGKQGRSVILLEKSLKEPDRIVGELLQPGGVRALEGLGLGDCLEDIDSIPVYGYQVTYYNEPVWIPYPEESSSRDAPGKRPEGRSFHHGRFIQKLRAAAMKTPNVTVVETTVTDVVRNGWTGQVLGVECEARKEKDYYFGALTLIADGYASKFRKKCSPHTPQVRSKFWGLELIDADLPMPNHGHVILSSGPPILLYQIGTHETRALIDIPDHLPSAAPSAGGVKNHLQNVVLPTLPACVRPSFAAAIAQGRFRSMPNSFLPPSTQRTPGLILLGDAMNMRHPLTGGGMTVGFSDVLLLSKLLAPRRVPALEDTKAVARQMRTFHWRRKSSAAVINILAMALYSLFAADDAHLKTLQLGCFRYFQLGGACIDGPVGLLAGIIRQPFVLFYHFFAVAFYAIWLRVVAAPAVQKPWVAVVGGGAVLAKAVRVIGPYIVSEVKV